MNKCMYYKHASEHACKRQERKEGGKKQSAPLSLYSTSTSKAKLQRMKGRVVF